MSFRVGLGDLPVFEDGGVGCMISRPWKTVAAEILLLADLVSRGWILSTSLESMSFGDKRLRFHTDGIASPLS